VASVTPAEARRRYLDVAQRKTGTLFRYPAELGALLSGAPVDSARTFASALALAFQILDDVLDLEGNPTLGKPGGGDLQRGLLTWPVIDWVETSVDPARAAQRVRNAKGDPTLLRQEILDSGAAQRSRAVAAFELGRAGACLDALPNGDGRRLLEALLAEVARR